MRVLYLHQHYKGLHSAGGTRSYELARRLVDDGHDVTVVAGVSAKTAPNRLIATEDGIRIVRLPIRYSQSFSFGRRLFSFVGYSLASTITSLRDKPDVVVASSTPLTVAIPGIVLKRIRRVPLVFEVRDLWPELPIATGDLRKPWLITLALGLEWLAYRHADAIVALSPGMADGIARKGVDRSRITIVPNGCDNSYFGISGMARERTQDPVALYAGAIGRINDLEWLVDVAVCLRQISSPVKIQVVGSGSEQTRIRGYAKNRQVLGSQFSLMDARPKVEMPSLISSATVGLSVFAPIKEMEANSSNKFFDYLAAGIPVAINYGGWQAQLLENSGSGIVLSRDPSHAAAKLDELCSRPELLTQMGSAARRLALAQFDRDTLAARFISVLESVVAKKGNRPTKPV